MISGHSGNRAAESAASENPEIRITARRCGTAGEEHLVAIASVLMKCPMAVNAKTRRPAPACQSSIGTDGCCNKGRGQSTSLPW